MTETRQQAMFTDEAPDLGYQIVTAVADECGTDPLELPVPLYEVVDIDALVSLHRSMDADGTVSFSYMGSTVIVTGDGTVLVGESDTPDGKTVGE